eukprot:scaffold3389_cov119-Cylindrotheca_fusiformis.AAC.13
MGAFARRPSGSYLLQLFFAQQVSSLRLRPFPAIPADYIAMKTLSSVCTLFVLRSSQAFNLFPKSSFQVSTRSLSSTTALMSKPFSIIVEAEIKPDRMEEFMPMIKNNAEQSRKEPGCMRFDVLRAQDNPNKFWFYEIYENASSVEFHKAQSHYQAWADFKESGGVVSSVTNKADGEYIG